MAQHTDRRAKDWKDGWREHASYIYMAIVIFDFLIAPIVWPLFQLAIKSPTITPWVPITLQTGGLLHLSFGAILGVSAWGKSQEKRMLYNTSDDDEGDDYQRPPPFVRPNYSKALNNREQKQEPDADQRPYIDPSLRG